MELQGKNIRRYVAIGDSITSGYADGALYYKGQISCYPALLAKRIQPQNFIQSLLKENSPGIGFNGNARIIAKKDPVSGNGYLDLTYISKTGDTNIFQRNETLPSTHNIGVPGLKSITALVPGYGNPANGEGNYNPFFYRICSNPPASSVLSDALTLDPDFFTLFLGNNDVLAYALYGGTNDSITPASTGDHNFEKAITTIVKTLTDTGAKGVLAGIPDILHIPYFNTISPEGLFTEKDGTINRLQKNDYVLLDILFDADRELLLSGRLPLPKKYVLYKDEISTISKTIHEYNILLKAIAGTFKLGFVDTNQLIGNVKKERHYNAVLRKINYSTSRIFSLDGVHLTPLGQALLANEFIHEMNTFMGTSFSPLKLTSYRL